jgi:hypothetical protein
LRFLLLKPAAMETGPLSFDALGLLGWRRKQKGLSAASLPEFALNFSTRTAYGF